MPYGQAQDMQLVSVRHSGLSSGSQPWPSGENSAAWSPARATGYGNWGCGRARMSGAVLSGTRVIVDVQVENHIIEAWLMLPAESDKTPRPRYGL